MEENQIVGLAPAAGKAQEPTPAERKAALLRQAEFYRVGIVHAKHTIKQGSKPDALFHSAIDHASWALRTRVDNLLRPTGINVASVMPYAVSIFGFLNRRRLVKPALGIAAVVAGAAYFLQRRRARLVH